MLARIIAGLLFFVVTCAPAHVAAADQQASANAKRSTPVSAGDPAPEFTLEDQDGRGTSLSAEWKTRPVVLIFYRGNW